MTSPAADQPRRWEATVEEWVRRVLAEVADDEIEDNPDEEVEGEADREKGDVEIGMAVAEEVAGGEFGGAGPWEEVGEAEEDGDEEEEHEGEEARGGIGDAADEGSPFSAGEVVEHDEAEGAEGDAEPEEVGVKVGAEELRARRGRKGGEGAGKCGGNADKQNDPPSARKDGGAVSRDAPP